MAYSSYTSIITILHSVQCIIDKFYTEINTSIENKHITFKVLDHKSPESDWIEFIIKINRNILRDKSQYPYRLRVHFEPLVHGYWDHSEIDRGIRDINANILRGYYEQHEERHHRHHMERCAMPEATWIDEDPAVTNAAMEMKRHIIERFNITDLHLEMKESLMKMEDVGIYPNMRSLYLESNPKDSTESLPTINKKYYEDDPKTKALISVNDENKTKK